MTNGTEPARENEHPYVIAAPAGDTHADSETLFPAQEGVLTVDVSGRILYANAAMEAALLRVPASRLAGALLADFAPPDRVRELRALLNLKTGQTRRLESVLLHREGRPIPVVLTATSIESGVAPCLCIVVSGLTGQKRDEEELVAAGHLACTVLNQAGEAIVVLDSQGVISSANHAAHALAGRNILFESFDSAFPVSSARNSSAVPLSHRLNAALGRSDSVRGIQADLVRPDGASASVLLSASPLFAHHSGDTGDVAALPPTFTVVTLADMTARKAMEENLALANERFQLAARALHGFVYECDLRTGAVTCSPGVQNILGEETIPSLDWWSERIHPDDRPAVLERHRSALAAGADSQGFEYRVRHRDGSYLHLWDRSLLLRDSDSSRVRVIGTVVDVTDRKRLEDALQATNSRSRRLIESNLIGVVTATMDRITEANDYFLHMVRATRADLEAGRIDWKTLTPPEHVERDLRALDQIHRTGACSPFEKEYIRADGVRVPILLGAVELTPEPFECACFIVDLTELKRTQRQLESVNAALAASNAELENFAFAASHDLQEPLRNIRAMTEHFALEYKGRIGPEADHVLTLIQTGVARMTRLISDLLEYSQATSEKRAPLSEIDLNIMVHSAMFNLRQRIADAQAEVTLSELPSVAGDEQLELVFQNLIANALKYRGEAPPRIVIAAHFDGRQWIVEVRDNGIGFDMRHAERIFQIFERLHTRHQYPGSGIGLALCKRIVERHGGRIWATSIPGEGSTFSFSLPATAATGNQS